MAVVAGVDFGTLSVRVSIVDNERGLLASAVAEYPLHRKREDPEYVTQSHEDHMRAVAEATREAVKKSEVPGEQVLAIALDTTGSSSLRHLAAARPLENWLKPVAGKSGTFLTSGVGLTTEITFVPFYELPRRRYAIYWDMFTPEEWKKKSEEYAAEQEKQKKLEAATVAFAQPGQMQSERDFNQQGEDSSPFQLEEHYGRRGTKWFSFDLPLDTAHPVSLVVTFSNDARRKGSFDVFVDGKKVGERMTERRSPEEEVHLIDVEYALPAELVQGKQKVTVRFEASAGGEIPGVFGIRIVHADVAR
jgi:hypothetical protein